MYEVMEDIREKKTNIVTLYPLTPIQGGFFFQSLYEKSSDAYFMQLILKLTGKLNISAFKQAWSMLLERHECLRASFTMEGLEEPIQIIHRKVNVVWHEEDWHTLPAEEQDNLLNDYITKDRACGFELNKAPLMRFGLFQYEIDQHVLLWSYHHILIDGWSIPIILNEIRCIYDSLVNTKPVNLPSRRPYGDYIAWLNYQDPIKAEDYWKQKLNGVVPTKLANKIIKNDEVQVSKNYTVLDEENSQHLSNYAAKLNITPNTVLQTLWGILLSVYTGQTDVVFGVIVSGRQSDLLGIESMVGIFINTIPLRIQLKGFESLEEMMKRVQSHMLEMQEYAYIPLWKIQSQQKEGGGGLFDSTYVYQNYPIQHDSSQSGLTINPVRAIEKMEYKLGITLSQQDSLSARVNYSGAHFTQEFIEQLILRFRRLILAAIHNPLLKVGELSLLSYEESQQFKIWNLTRHAYPKNKYTHELIDEISISTPDAIAVICEDRQISYKELSEKSNQLAHYLNNLGVEAEIPVVLAIERSIEMVIGILGILKAGGTYVPIDVNYPKERLEYMLEDSSAPFILSRSSELAKLTLSQLITIDLDEIEDELEQQQKSIPPQKLSPQNLAYIIYTSGSTGRPKGVTISHDSLNAYLSWAKTAYAANNDKPILFHGSVCFDMSITSLFVPLLTGKSITIVKEDFSKMLEEKNLKESYGFVKLTPSHLKLIKESSHYKLSDLSDCFVVGGENFTGEYLTKGNLTFFNEYGPTETTVACSIYKVDNTKNYQNIPIGTPIWNMEMYILDPYLNLVPIDVIGEIYIGGLGLARGYLNQPGLTAEKFIPNPFDTNTRLYKTGDLGRFLPDGNIEFLGRIDHQLKIRGFRVELGEIEEIITNNEKVQQAIVLYREDNPDQKRLVAYVLLKTEEAKEEILAYLQNLCQIHLPDYMQPNQWMILDSFPLTPNGKIDRKALPVPEGREGLGAYKPPEGWLEKQLAAIWTELLGVEVSRNDDFFRLGGHSLLATQMVSRLREVLKREVPLKAIFECSILFELAHYLEQPHLDEGILPVITRVPRDKCHALSFAQQRLWFIEQLLPNTELYHNPIRVKISGRLNITALRQSLNALVARHEILRTVIINLEGIASQRILAEGTEFNLQEAESENSNDIELFIKKPFQFEREPLCRGLLIKHSEQEHILILVFHHIIIDDWSVGIFFNELNAFYRTYTEGGEVSLQPLSVQYVDYSVWQRTWLTGEILEKQLGYWKTQLNEISTLELPYDYLRPKELSYQGGRVERKLSKELLEQLQAFTKSQGMTLFMSVLASVQAFLSRYCNQRDIAIGTPIAQRRVSETEGIIGFFVNSLVIRNHFDDNLDFAAIMKRVESATLSAYDNQDVPFEQLVEFLQVPRELNRNPLFLVMFNLQYEGEKLDLGECNVLFEENQGQLSRFDLLIGAFIGKEEIRLTFDYAKDLFKEERIKQIAEYYETFLQAILNEPSRRILEIPILGKNERQKILAWNEPRQNYSKGKCIHQLFEEQVEKTPFNIAVVYENQEITYRKLNERANQLAHWLRKKGVGPEKYVLIALERSIEIIIAILGVLKAGGIYVPMDPSYPEERLIFMLEDTGAPLLITQDSLKEVFLGYNKILYIDGNWSEVEQERKDNPYSTTLPNHLAYIIYTSGSTGKPKGVMVSHNEVISFALNNNYLTMNDKTVTLSFSNYVFDGSIFDIFTTLLNAGKLIITHKHDILNVQKLEQLLVRHAVNTAFVTTALFSYYSKLIDKNPLYHISNLLFGGEKINYEDLNVFLKGKHSSSCLIHVYGPTENIVFSTFCYLNEKNIQPAPIGKRLSDKTIYILDRGMQPVSIGVVGELYIGQGLARGYLNRGELTAERFVPNPFITEADILNKRNLRLYRTGDLARYLNDGNIEFLGRIDDQVKIRGFRIELSEIEICLTKLKEVIQSHVVMLEENGVKQLVAYVVPINFELPNLTEIIKKHLIINLPDYMIPAFFVFLDKLPLSSSGKIDKKALPVPDFSLRQATGEYIAPQTTLQQRIADVWCQVLRIDQIGVNDNFFRIGGDSIMSIQLVAKARQQGIYFAVKDIFNHPTIAALSLVANIEESSSGLKPFQGQCHGNTPFTPIQAWFFKQNFPNVHHYNQANLLLMTQADFNLLRKSFELILNLHDVLRCRYYKNADAVWQQDNLLQEDIHSIWHEIDLSLVKDTELNTRIEQEANILQQSLNIKTGPIIKVAVFHCGNRAARLLIVIHHLVIDGVSWRILLEDLQQIYHSLQENKLPHLIKTHSFQQWSSALEDYAKSEVFKPQIKYWQEISNAVKLLPIDFNKGSINILDAVTVDLNEEQTLALLQKAPGAYRTQVNDLLLTSLLLAVGDWTKDYSISLALEGHGREDIIPDIDLSRTLGWFTSVFPVNLKISNSEDLGNAIKTVKEILRSIPHKGIGYGIAKYLCKDSIITNNFEPNLSFNYLGQWDNTLSKQSLFAFAEESAGNEIDEKNTNPYFLTINGNVRNGKLIFAWNYSIKHYHRDTIEKIANGFIQRLTQLILHCCQGDKFGYTPSDFTLISISQEKLDATFGAIPNIETLYPLSPMQTGFLFHTLYAPHSDAYLVQLLLELTGDLQVSTFKEAWKILIEQHESLRASFIWEDMAEPLQVIQKKVELFWHEENWSEFSDEQKTELLNAYIKEDRARGFNFNQAPLIRFGLFKYDNQKYYLLWTYHHILSDGWSCPIKLNEVKTIYDSLINKKSIQLQIRRPYQDYIAWLGRQDQKKAEDYWKKILAEATPTKLASKVIRENSSQSYGESPFTLSLEISERLSRFASQLDTTLNTVLQALWGILLSVYTRQDDVVFGVTVSGRQLDLEGIESMVGIFINTLPLRMRLKGFESIEEIIKNTQTQMLGMQEHAYIPLWKIQPQQKEGGGGLFDCTYVFQNYPMLEEKDNSSGLKLKLAAGIEKMEYKLGINISYQDCLCGRINYNEAYFTQNFVEQMFFHFECLILNVLANPSQKLGELSCISPKELNQLSLWNDTEHDFPKHCCLHDLFEDSVKRYPNVTAVVYREDKICYRELNERSNQLAHYLRDLGVEAEIPVALAIEPSIEMMIGLLGILKAGGIYVPLDINYPQERLEYMLEDSGAPFIVSRRAELEKLSITQQIVVDLDEIKNDLQGLPKTLPQQSISPANLAYIIYTSGSTGKPKGVGISHRSVVNLVMAQRQSFSYHSETRTLHFASISFDASISEWGCTFAEGSTLVLGNNKDITAMVMVIDQQQINQMTIPPSVLKTMSPEIISKHCKQIVIAGETADLTLIETYQRKGLRIINAYGPTEGAVCSSVCNLETVNQQLALPVNQIGRPIWNVKIHILDRYLNPVPIGIAGEIYIGGINLARGYFNKPILTADKFIPNPFSVGDRLYKTGDLGRYLSNGNIEFLGRTDDQVKVRGFRIELGEIERTIEINENVQQSVVICQDNNAEQKRLIAYVVPKVKSDNIEDLLNALKDLCKRQLPDYMQPSQWLTLDSLPLTPSGKIDRKTLKEREDQFVVKEIALAKNSIEQALSEIFKELLNLTQTGIDTNFFEVGGNSLLAVNLLLNIKKELGVKIQVIDIFENPTIRMLAELISRSHYSELNSHFDNSNSIFIIQKEGNLTPLFLIHPGVGLSLPYLPLREFIVNRPIIGIDDPYFGEEISGFKSLEEMANSYLSIIKKIQKTGPYYLAGWSFGGMVAYEIARQLEEMSDSSNSLILIEAANPMMVDEMVFKDERVKQEFENKVDRNVLLARKYQPNKISASLSLIKAQLAFNELTEESYELMQKSKYGWKNYCANIVEYTVPGEHATLFDREYLMPLGNIIHSILTVRLDQ